MLEYIYNIAHKVQGRRGCFSLDKKGRVYDSKGSRFFLPSKVKCMTTEETYCVAVDKKGRVWRWDKGVGFRHIPFPHSVISISSTLRFYYIVTSIGELYIGVEDTLILIPCPEPMFKVVCSASRGYSLLISRTAAVYRTPDYNPNIITAITGIAMIDIAVLDDVFYATFPNGNIYACKDYNNFRLHKLPLPEPIPLYSSKCTIL